MNKDLNLFFEKSQNLSVSLFHPHKYILLLAIVYLYHIDENRPNKIYLDSKLINYFNKIVERIKFLFDLEKISIEYPFFHLKNDGFWFLKIKEGKDNSYEDIIRNHKSRFTLKRLYDIFEYAYLSEKVHADLHDASIRKEIVEKIKNIFYIHQKNKVTKLGDNPKNPSGEITISCYSLLNYLSTLQRINGANENALAEFQASNPFFKRIAVPHPLEEELVRDLREGKHCIVLTGHAGDGKTTLAFAVYRRLCGFSPNSDVPELQKSRISFSLDGHEGLLIKDLSEQERSRDKALFAELMDSTKRSLLVSNTGALCEFFTAQESDSSRKAELEMKLLQCLSEEKNTFAFRDRSFKIYNLALRDNLPLARQVLNKMLAPDIWQNCEGCAKPHCPVRFNRTLLAGNPAQERLFLVYRRMQAYGARLTMRQLSEHLAWCLSGGLRETNLCRGRPLTFDAACRWHFYNLFWGDDGIHVHPNTAEMAVIRAAQEQNLGVQSLPCLEKKLWHVHPVEPAELWLPPQTHEVFRQWLRLGSTHQTPSVSAAARLQARRLMYFCAEPSDISERLQEEFLMSPGLLAYKRLSSDPKLRQHLLDCLFLVLQEHFTGMVLPSALAQNRHKVLYITLNQPDRMLRQSAQIVLCSVSWEENFHLLPPKNEEMQHKVCLVGRRNLRGITPLELSIPFLDYVLRRYEGNMGALPRATFGQQLDTLKSQILRCMKEEEDMEYMKILRYCSDFHLEEDKYYWQDAQRLEVIRGTH